MTFENWLNTFLEEKRIDLEHIFEVPSNVWGIQNIPLAVIVEYVNLNPEFQPQVKNTLILLDFKNASIVDYFEHLALGLAKSQVA